MKDKNNLDVILHADDFLLRPWEIEDAQWYVESRDEEVFRWTKEKRELTVREVEEGIRRANNNPDALCLAVVDNKCMELLGNIALVFEENDRKSAEIMYWFAPWGRGRGIATRSVKLLCQWAFDALGLERVTLKTLAGNIRSQLVAQRAGFQRQKVEQESEMDTNHVWFELVHHKHSTDFVIKLPPCY